MTESDPFRYREFVEASPVVLPHSFTGRSKRTAPRTVTRKLPPNPAGDRAAQSQRRRSRTGPPRRRPHSNSVGAVIAELVRKRSPTFLVEHDIDSFGFRFLRRVARPRRSASRSAEDEQRRRYLHAGERSQRSSRRRFQAVIGRSWKEIIEAATQLPSREHHIFNKRLFLNPASRRWRRLRNCWRGRSLTCVTLGWTSCRVERRS